MAHSIHFLKVLTGLTVRESISITCVQVNNNLRTHLILKSHTTIQRTLVKSTSDKSLNNHFIYDTNN